MHETAPGWLIRRPEKSCYFPVLSLREPGLKNAGIRDQSSNHWDLGESGETEGYWVTVEWAIPPRVLLTVRASSRGKTAPVGPPRPTPTGRTSQAVQMRPAGKDPRIP